MEYDRKKEADPLKTIERARKILTELGIMTTESWKRPFSKARPEPRAFSVRLDAPGYGVGTNGKGSSRSYALASAYGEFMERLQNLILLPVERFTAASLKEQGFLYFPDERICAIEDIIGAEDSLSSAVYRDFYRESFLLECGERERANVISAYRAMEAGSLDAGFVTWPFYSVRQDETVYIWNGFATYLHGSNGMCAGNTPAEALVQGLSEIFERYASQQILIEDIIPPDIPFEEYAGYETVMAVIREIEDMGPFKILVKDCSLGKGIPVCAVVILDQEKQRYRASFGCHPHMPVAIERCLTELLQGYDPASGDHNDMWLIPIDLSKKSIPPHLNVRNMQSNGMGILPSEFFAGTPSYSHVPFADMAHAGNGQMLRYCIDLALSLSDDILVRDVSYLGFPAYFIMAPGISHYPATQNILRMDAAYASLANMGQYKQDLSEAKLKKLLVGLNRWESTSSKAELPCAPYKLKTAVLLMLGQFDSAIVYLEHRASRNSFPNDHKELGALLKTLKYMADGKSREETERFITLIYSQRQWKDICEKWLCENPVEAILKDVPEDGAVSDYDRAVNEIFCKLKRKFSETVIVQDDLREILGNYTLG